MKARVNCWCLRIQNLILFVFVLWCFQTRSYLRIGNCELDEISFWGGNRNVPFWVFLWLKKFSYQYLFYINKCILYYQDLTANRLGRRLIILLMINPYKIRKKIQMLCCGQPKLKGFLDFVLWEFFFHSNKEWKQNVWIALRLEISSVNLLYRWVQKTSEIISKQALKFTWFAYYCYSILVHL